VAKRSKHQFHFNSAFVVRLCLFLLFFIVSVTVLSNKITGNNQNGATAILGAKTNQLLNQIDYQEIINSIYQQIPPKSREKIENLNHLPLYLTIQQQIQPVLSQLQDFPDRQIKEIKKEIINRIYRDIIKSIENN
jgi:predicted PurR-regulated permease PerM